MIKFQIIIEKKDTKKTIKPFLGKTTSSLALVLSVLVLSTVIGLGIHLVFAAPFTNPTADPPLENVEGPINVSDVAQMKGGDLFLKQAFQDDPATSEEDKNWQLTEAGFVGSINLAVFDSAIANKVRAWDRLFSDDKIEAPNQHREHEEACIDGSECKSRGPSSAAIFCPAGKFLYEIHISDDGKSSYGYCAAPFVKTSSLIIPGGGIRPDKEEFKRGVGGGAFGDW